MVFRVNKNWLAGIVAALLLFAQFAVAAQQCDRALQDDACVTHCVADEQASTLDHHFAALPSFPSMGATRFAVADVPQPLIRLADERLPGGPPPRVRFCSYLD